MVEEMGNVIVRPRVFDRHRQTIRSARLLLIAGTVQRQDGVISLLARRVTSL